MTTLLTDAFSSDVSQQIVGVLILTGIPDRIVIFDNAQADTGWMNFLTHLTNSYFSETFTVM